MIAPHQPPACWYLGGEDNTEVSQMSSQNGLHVSPAGWRARAVLNAALGILLVAPAAVADGAGVGDEGPPSCSVVAGRPWQATNAGPRRAELWIDCDYRVIELRFATNRDITAIYRPQLYRATAADRLTCTRKGARGGSCSGSIRSHVRVRLGMRMRAATCGAPRLRVQVDGFGGIDCSPGQACAEIGFVSSGASGRPLGCGG